MTTATAPQLHLRQDGDRLMVDLIDPAGLTTSDGVNFRSGHLNHENILHALIAISRPLLYDHLPHPQFSMSCPETLYHDEKIGPVIHHFLGTLDITNQFLLRHLDKKSVAKNFENRLFYELNQKDFHDIYDLVKEKDPEKTRYESFEIGFDNLKREYVSGHERFMNADQLVDYVFDKKIGVIISVNMYYLELHLKVGLHLPAILNFLGVEYIAVDLDLYENAYLLKLAFNCNSFRRYSIHEHAQGYWDRSLGMKNVQYIPSSYVKKTNEQFIELHSDFDIVIASNARLKDLYPIFDLLLYLFEDCRDDHLFDDFQMWYFASKYYLLTKTPTSLEEKCYCNYFLYVLYLNGISVLKYEVISQLRTDKKILLYGDSAWGDLFPQYYQNEYLNDYEGRFKSGRSLNLLVNANYSYLESNPVFQRALSLKTPYLCFPALFKTKELEPLQTNEYSSTKELNQKLNQINELTFRPDAITARATVAEWINTGTFEAVNDLLGRSEYRCADPKIFQTKCHEHQSLAASAYEEYIRLNQDKIDRQFKMIFRNQRPEKDLKDLKFFKRDYTQRILRLILQSQNARPS